MNRSMGMIVFNQTTFNTGKTVFDRHYPSTLSLQVLPALCAKEGYVRLPHGQGMLIGGDSDEASGSFMTFREDASGLAVPCSECAYCTVPGKREAEVFGELVTDFRSLVEGGAAAMLSPVIRKPDPPWLAVIRISGEPDRDLEGAIFAALTGGARRAPHA